MLNEIGEQVKWLFSGAGVVFGAFVFGSLRYYYVDRKRVDSHVEVFPGTEGDEKYNVKFYEYFRKAIGKAMQHIYITGDGFSCADAEGESLAREFNIATKAALRKGVHVVRIQTRSNTSKRWAEILKELLEEFPDSFHLYLLRENNVSQMSSTCVIDPETSKSVVEVMLSTVRMIGSKSTDIAKTAIFIHGKNSLAKDMRERILSLTSEEVSFRITEAEQVVPMLTAKTELYFSYGSNMSERQMSERIGKTEFVGIGYLSDYRLVFNRKGSYRPGGVASVIKTKGSQVFGTIWNVPAAKLVEMDEFEDPNAYVRKTENVIGSDGKEYSCQMYISIPQGDIAPDPTYLELVIASAEEVGLPPKYVEELKKFRS